MHHYNAFISYNHNPRDIAIARKLQRQLENFKVPAGISTTAPGNKIERIFLDTGELEVAGDLNTVICNALENTDYLIVICSPDSRQSIWVKREIEYYLRNHSIESILTVITEGEPADVLPEVLMGREPLSCDYRLPPRAARNVELPRLAAVLLGCRYDDLVQRQRHYRQRRIGAAVAVSFAFLLVLTSYLIWSNNKIRANLEASLRAESRALALRSENALSTGDRISAIRYALEALPSEDTDRPVVSEAVFALSEAMNLYKSDSSIADSAVRRYPSYGVRHLRLETGVADDSIFMAELYTSGRCVLWNGNNGQELMADYTADLIKEGSSVQNLAFTKDGTLILVTQDSIRVLDCAKETETSNIPIDGKYYKVYDFNVVRAECDNLLIKGNDIWIPVGTLLKDPDNTNAAGRYSGSRDTEERAASLSRDRTEIADLSAYVKDIEAGLSFRIIRIDMETGEIKAETDAPGRPISVKISPDGRHLACLYSEYYGYDSSDTIDDDHIEILNADDLTPTGRISSAFISGIAFDDHDRIYLCGYDKMPEPRDLSMNETLESSANGSRNILSLAADRDLKLACYDASSCNEIWSNIYRVHVGGKPGIGITDEDDIPSDAVVCSVGNLLQITGADGRDIGTLYPLSTVCMLFIGEKGFSGILSDGQLVNWDYDEAEGFSSITAYNHFLGPVLMYAEAGGSTFIVSNDTGSELYREIVTEYRGGGNDPLWADYEYDGDPDAQYGNMTFLDAGPCGNLFTEVRITESTGAGNSMAEIIARDSESGGIMMRHYTVTGAPREGNEDEYTNYMYSGIDSARRKVYFIDNHDFLELTIKSVDIDSGREELIPLSVNNGQDTGSNDYIRGYFILTPDDTYESGENFSLDGKHISYAAVEFTYYKNSNSSEYSMVVLEADPETGETTVHETGETLDLNNSYIYTYTTLNAAAKRLVGLRNSRFICQDFDGRMIWESEEVPYTPAGFCCADDGTVAALENGSAEAVLHIYSSKDGSETAAIDLGSVGILSYEKMGITDMHDGVKMITAGDDAYFLDGDTLELRASIKDNYVAYNPETRQLMLGDVRYRKTGHVPYRTVDELISEAQEFLGF